MKTKLISKIYPEMVIELCEKSIRYRHALHSGMFIYKDNLYIKYDNELFLYNYEKDELEENVNIPINCSVKYINSMKFIPNVIHKFLLEIALDAFKEKMRNIESLLDNITDDILDSDVDIYRLEVYFK